MTYTIIQPPFTLKFREMSKDDLNAYFEWFMNQIPERLTILKSVIRETPGFENWSADFTAESLSMLGEWYATQVEARPRSQEELNAIKEKMVFPVSVSSDELTNKTFSLAIDLGMYLSIVFKTNFPSLRWDLILKNKKFVDYGQPVLVGFKGGVPLNPVGIMVVLAYGLAKKTKSGARLLELYNYWSAQVA